MKARAHICINMQRPAAPRIRPAEPYSHENCALLYSCRGLQASCKTQAVSSTAMSYKGLRSPRMRECTQLDIAQAIYELRRVIQHFESLGREENR